MHAFSPLWLWALAAVALPVALHLLSRGRGRRVPLASTRLLQAELSLRGRRLRPSDLPLLALRAALLAVVALALAGLWRESPEVARPGSSWLLLEPGLPPAAGKAAEDLRRLRAAAAAVRFLAPGLPSDDPGPMAEPPDVWSLLAEADVEAPAGVELHVRTRARLAELRGERPALRHAVSWVEAAAAPEPVRTLVEAGPWQGGTVRALVQSSERERSVLETLAVPAGGTVGGVTATPQGDRVAVALGQESALSTASAQPVALALRVAAEHAASARVLRSACDVAAAALGAELRWVDQPAGARLRFWLDDADVPAAWTSGDALLLTEARAPGAPCDTAGEAADASVAVSRCEAASSASATAVLAPSAAPPAPELPSVTGEWRSASGAILLGGDRNALHLATRLDTEWSALARSDLPPRWCAGWLAAALERDGMLATAPERDARWAAEEQRLPGRRTEQGRPSHRVELEPWLWLAAAGLAFGERRRARSAG